MGSEEGDEREALEWRSDRVVLLGRGLSIDVWLPFGLHEVSAIVADGAGCRGRDTRCVHVRVPLLVTVNVSEDTVDRACDAAHGGVIERCAGCCRSTRHSFPWTRSWSRQPCEFVEDG